MSLATYWSVVGALVLGILIGDKLAERECADCHVGNIDPTWWRKAVALAKFRKSERVSS